ncbi:acylphosphatase [bacterium]|nr:acylphosphatase [bacterium]
MERHVQVLVEGIVQGVFFREYTRRKAQSLGLKGSVRNLPNGCVEIRAQGNMQDIDFFIQWCWEGSPLARVENVLVTEAPLDYSLLSFLITY